MSRNFLALLFIVLWSFITILVLTWGVEVVWPDYVHVDYGYPLVWGTHVLNTIMGPVDKWIVDLKALVIDLALWLGIMVTVLTIILHFKKHS